MKNDPFNVAPYWEQQGEPKPPGVPVAGGERLQRFHAGDTVRVPFSLAGFPPAGVYTVRAAHCDPITQLYSGCGVWGARYDLVEDPRPVYDDGVTRP